MTDNEGVRSGQGQAPWTREPYVQGISHGVVWWPCGRALSWEILRSSQLTLVLLNCFNCIFRHLKLELLTQFPASNDEKYNYLWKINMCENTILINWASITDYFMDFSVILFPLKLTRNRIYTAPAAQGLKRSKVWSMTFTQHWSNATDLKRVRAVHVFKSNSCCAAD